MKEKVSHEDLTIYEDYTIHTYIFFANFSDNFFYSEFNALSSDINHFRSHQFYSPLLNSSMNFSLVFLFFIFDFIFGNCRGNIYPHLAALVVFDVDFDLVPFQSVCMWRFFHFIVNVDPFSIVLHVLSCLPLYVFRSNLARLSPLLAFKLLCFLYIDSYMFLLSLLWSSFVFLLYFDEFVFVFVYVLLFLWPPDRYF